MNPPQQLVGTIDPDMQNISLEQVAKLGDSVLARSLDLYRERLAGNGEQRYAFDSSI